DDRHGKTTHPLHHCPGHAGEVEERPGIGPLELTDDVVDVATGAEPPALSRDHQDADIVAMLDLGEQVAQVGVDVEGECVETVGAVQGHRGHPVVDGESEVVPALSEAGRCSMRAHDRPDGTASLGRALRNEKIPCSKPNPRIGVNTRFKPADSSRSPATNPTAPMTIRAQEMVMRRSLTSVSMRSTAKIREVMTRMKLL